MGQKQLTLASLCDYEGGGLAAKFQQLLTQAGTDCWNRPGLTKSRVVTLQVELIPELDHDGLIEFVKTKVNVNLKMPKFASRQVRCNIQKSGALVFNADSPENPNQGTFDFDHQGESEA